MAYTVLARKYRSWTFDELVGQDAVATTLKNAITSGRLHHGYLFCGTRGVGKTSAARILARSLNCLSSDRPTVTPCCRCESCVAIAEGQDIDVIEIDAASNTGVDNIRELRNNALFRPARSRFKIYIIDEVHMLSTGAFNALLKTLEEPPGHVKFILATTEPQKVPATIQSRCLRFDFRSISVDRIAAHFDAILAREKVQADPGVTRRVARLANGSMRDGLSLLDQLLSLGAERLTLRMLDDVLPVPHDELVLQLIGQLAGHDPAGALATVDAAVGAGYSLERLCESLAEQFRAAMLLRLCGPETALVDLPEAARVVLRKVSQQIEAESCVHAIAVLEELRRTVRFSSLGRALVDAAVVRLAGTVSYRSLQSILDELSAGSTAAPSPGAGSRPAAAPSPATGSRPAAAAGPAGRSAGPPPAAKAGPLNAASAGPTSPPPTDPPAAAPPPARRTTGNRRPAANPAPEDVHRARSNPTVREALDLFGGTLVNVERVRPSGDAPGPPDDDPAVADAGGGQDGDPEN